MSRWSDLIFFAGTVTHTQNEMGDSIPVESNPVMVYANKKAIRQSEFYQAHANGLKPELSFEIRSIDYSEQKALTYNDKRYEIIRTYDKGEKIELICEGVVNRGDA